MMQACLLLFVLAACSVQNKLKGPFESGWQGQKVCEKLHESKHQNILRCTFPPGIGHEKHQHNNNFGYAIAGGTMQITDAKGTRKVNLKTNSYFNSEAPKWHEVVNIGQTTIIYLIIESK